MALRRLRLEGDSILHKVSKPIENIDNKTNELIDDMLETMYNAGGVGLAAVQVGVLKRVFVADISEDRDCPMVFINPTITKEEGSRVGWEGCLSIPGMSGKVTRPQTTTICATDRFGNDFELCADDVLSVVINHEMDHLNGLLLIQRAEEMKSNDEVDNGVANED